MNASQNVGKQNPQGIMRPSEKGKKECQIWLTNGPELEF